MTCIMCKKARTVRARHGLPEPATYKCRHCGKRICEHLCGSKNARDMTATCTACALRRAS